MLVASTLRGTVTIALSALCFGAVFYLSGALDLPTFVVIAWRLTITAGCYAVISLAVPAARAALRDFWGILSAHWSHPLIFLGLTTMMGAQLWLFSWAPSHGHGLDASLGFLLMPLSLVAGGRFLLGASVTRIQWIAVGFAAVAVGTKIVLDPHVSWVTFAICLGYPLYFIARRRFGLDNVMVHGVELWLIAPVVVVLAAGTGAAPTTAGTVFLLVALACAGAAAMALYLASSTMLSVPMFGLLGYIEPVLLVAVSLLLGESLAQSDAFTYALLAIALCLMIAGEFGRNAVREPGR